MKKLFNCRRSLVSCFGILSLTVIALVNKLDVALSIAAICGAVAGANAFQGSKEPKETP
jgi:hypothetical protein